MVEPTTAPRRDRASWLKRVGWPCWALCALGLAIVGGIAWASEPMTRRRVLFESPLRLEPGTVVQGSFRPEHDSYAILLFFPREEPLDSLGSAIGGGWMGEQSPPRFKASYVLHNAKDTITGATGEQIDGWFTEDKVGIYLGRIWHVSLSATSLEVRIEQADAALLSRNVRLQVIAIGDWIAYNHVESFARGVLVGLGALAGLGVIFGAVRRRARLRRERREELQASNAL